MRRIGPLVLGIGIGAATISWGPGLVEQWRTFALLSSPPISIPAATAHWVDERNFDIEAPAYFWSDTCPSIWVNWWVQTRWNGAVPITTKGIEGPFKDRGTLPPRYRISITPQVGPPLRIRATIPEWLAPEDVLLVGVDDTVPDNEPCVSGWAGVIQIFRLQITPAPAVADATGPGRRHTDEVTPKGP
ncbi:MAG: hypothetical protein WAS21_28710 [Geminicoccaceae bacterium]